MPIEVKTGCTIVTGNSIKLYRLLAIKSALRLEMVGLRHSRGVNAAKLAREAIGSKTKNKAALLKELEEFITVNQGALNQ